MTSPGNKRAETPPVLVYPAFTFSVPGSGLLAVVSEAAVSRKPLSTCRPALYLAPLARILVLSSRKPSLLPPVWLRPPLGSGDFASFTLATETVGLDYNCLTSLLLGCVFLTFETNSFTSMTLVRERKKKKGCVCVK